MESNSTAFLIKIKLRHSLGRPSRSDFVQSEVIAMSIFEYDKEEEEKKLRKAEYEAGYNTGYDTGYGRGYDIGKKEIVRQMFNAGESFEKIAQYTGYEVRELKEILDED